jgi:dienelactone hydrolase
VSQVDEGVNEMADYRSIWPAGGLPALLLGLAIGPAAGAVGQITMVDGVPGGSGPYKAIVTTDSSLGFHVVYRPAQLHGLAGQRMPVVVWGNGGCSDNGTGVKDFLREVASYGFMVIATGVPGGTPVSVAADRAQEPAGVPTAPGTGPGPGNDQTRASQLLEALDWAVRQDDQPGSPYRNALNVRKLAVMGWSCGGLQALEVSADARISTSMIWDSGIYNRGSGRSGIQITKDALSKLHAPVAYIIGGPTDIAYPNAVDDFERINQVPVLMANLDVGHGGTFRQPNGGRYAVVAVAWLRWQLLGDGLAAAEFVGPRCGLCTDSGWSVRKKGID